MNILSISKQRAIFDALWDGKGVRQIARELKVNRETVARYRRVKALLQEAYDAMWNAEPDRFDEICKDLPERLVLDVGDAWVEDSCGREPKSKWY